MAKDELRPDIAAAVGRMANKLGANRELRKLAGHLWEGEKVSMLVSGTYGRGTGLLVLTDRRLLFTYEGWTNATTEDFAFDNITSVQWSSGMMLGTVTIFAAGVKAEIKNVDKGNGKQFVDQVRSFLATSKPAQQAATAPPTPAAGSDPMEQLRQLGQLKDAGVLTDEEFQTKKAEILARL